VSSNAVVNRDPGRSAHDMPAERHSPACDGPVLGGADIHDGGVDGG